MCWWLALARKKMWRWIASFGESYHGDVLQFAKQIFSVRLLLMTKFFVMRKCDNILSGSLCAVTTGFSQQMEFMVLKSPNGFWRPLPQRSHSFLNSFLDPNQKT